MEYVMGGWKKVNNEKVRNVYFSSNIVIVIKSKMMKWAGQVACM
jgi:hypothetical protein